MEKLKHINWSEVVRREEAKLRGKDRARIARASLKMDELRREVEGWSGVEEIRRWRERRGR